MDYAKESLRLHGEWKGKIEVVATVPVKTKDDLSLAYTPGVAQPCLEIQKDIEKSYELTRRHNLCAVITDTGRFQYQNANGEAFEVASMLVDAGARPDEVAVDGMRAGIHRLERTKTGVARGIRSDRAGPLGGEDTTVASDPHLRHGSPVAGQSDRVDVTVDRVADQTGGVGGRPGGWRRRVGDTGGRDSGKGCRGRGRRWRDDDVVAPQRGPPIGSREGLG